MKAAMKRDLVRVVGPLICALMLLIGHADVTFADQQRPGDPFEVAVVEHLRIKVPAEARQAWLEAERGSWEPWLAQQPGYQGRDLLWDEDHEEGTLLIRWASRRQWKGIAPEELEAVQEQFERLARQATGIAQGNPFPLVFEGELQPAA